MPVLLDANRPHTTARAATAGPYDSLRKLIETKAARIGIIGLGYVGLPLARAFARGGYRVLGFDTDVEKVAQLDRGRSYIAHIPSESLTDMRSRGFEATDRFDRLSEDDVVIVCVPTPLTEAREPDLSYVTGSADAIAARLRPGQLVVLESTTYPGTTRLLVKPILESTGLKAGEDFFLAYSPEREDPGNARFSAPTIPKVVGGNDRQSADLAMALYGHVVIKVVPVSSTEVAEACKILENTYRAVNIALVNELKVLYDRMGIDVWEVIEAAKTKPFGFQPFYPGPGLGGHCIPIDPFYLTWAARKYGLTTRFIELAGEVNAAMPAYVVQKVIDGLNDHGKPAKGSRVTIIGLAYKKDVDDLRESPALEIIDLLRAKGADVNYHDPLIPRMPVTRHYPHLCLESRPLAPEYLRSQDCVVIVTDHSAYDWEEIVAQAPLVVDARGATRGVPAPAGRVIRA
jgi:UDP-N-acetyl-D-glucosamine dehydrogenase